MAPLLRWILAVRARMLLQICRSEGCPNKIRKDIGPKILYNVRMGCIYNLRLPLRRSSQIPNTFIDVVRMRVTV